MAFLTYDEFMLIESISEESEYLIETLEDIDILKEYLYDVYNIELNVDEILNEENKPEEPKKSVGQKVKGHFKKHWKKYAAGAALAGAGAYGAHKAGLFNGKNKTTTKTSPKEHPETTAWKKNAGEWENRANKHEKVTDWAMKKAQNEKDPAKHAKYANIVRRNSGASTSALLNMMGNKKLNHKEFNKGVKDY